MEILIPTARFVCWSTHQPVITLISGDTEQAETFSRNANKRGFGLIKLGAALNLIDKQIE